MLHAQDADPLRTLNELQQQHKIRFDFGPAERVGGPNHLPRWQITLQAQIPGEARVVVAHGHADSKTRAKRAAIATLSSEHDEVAHLLESPTDRDQDTDRRPVFVLTDWIRRYMSKRQNFTVWLGAKHAHRLAAMVAAGGVVAIDTEGRDHTSGRAVWIQVFDGRQTVLILPAAECWSALRMFLRHDGVQKLFWDTEADAARLPPVVRSTDVQEMYGGWWHRQHAMVVRSTSSTFSLSEAFETLMLSGTNRVCKLPERTDTGAFYATFNMTGNAREMDLDHLHREYAVADVVALWHLHHHMLTECAA